VKDQGRTSVEGNGLQVCGGITVVGSNHGLLTAAVLLALLLVLLLALPNA